MPVQLTEEQLIAVQDQGGDLLVSAAAGSGKTRVLVERLLRRVEEGADIDRFLVITYTKAAAAELRDRIGRELSERLAAQPGNAFLRRQTTLLYKAQISTIHSFCGRFLREEGHRLELDHDFRLMDENEGSILLKDTLDRLLDSRYETIEQDPDFAFLVNTMGAGRDDSRLSRIVLDVRNRVQSHQDPDRWLREQEEVFALRGVTDAGETPWGRLLLADARRQAEYWAARMGECLELTRGDAALERAYADSLTRTVQSLKELADAAAQGWDAAALACARVEFPNFGRATGCQDPQAKDRITALRKTCKTRWEKLSELFLDDSAGLLEDMQAVFPAIRGLFALIRDLERAFTEEKRRRGTVDYSDLEHLTVALLTGPQGEELSRRWGDRFEEVMVDEYQDTNAVQNAIFTALTAGRGNLFMVGDVKQSIYRFRLADPTIFLEKYRTFPPAAQAKEGEPRRVLLSRNFRSRPQVLEGANYVFRAVMSREFGEMDYTDDEALIPGGTLPEEDRYGVEMDLLDCSQAGEEEGPQVARDLLEARFAARRIDTLLQEKFPVSDGQGGVRPLLPGDVVILLRSPGTVLHHYAQALTERNIPWEADGGGDFFGSPETQAALSLLRIVDNPRQDVALIAALRSPAWAFSPDRLAMIRAGSPNTDFYTALTQDQGEDTAAFLRELGELRLLAQDKSCDRLVWELYDRTNLPGIFGALPDGEKAQANLLLLAQLARDFQREVSRGLFDFLRWLDRVEEMGGKLPLPKAGVAGGGVRILSIHRSKGLEFPVVLLCGLTRKLNKTDRNQPMLFHPRLGVGPKRLDTDRMVEWSTLSRMAVARQMEYELSAEELRLLYVAMTRPKDKLILSCALTGGKKDLEKLLPDGGAPVEPQALLDMDSPGKWLLAAALARPEAAEFWDAGFRPPVRPDTDFGPAWDLRWIDASPFAQGPGEEEVQEEVREETAHGPDLTALFSWTYPHREDSLVPSKLTATQLKGRFLDQETQEDAEPERPALRFDRPRFAAQRLGLTPAQRGTALHLVMQYIDFGKCSSTEEVAGEIRRLVDDQFLTPEQGEAVDPRKIRDFFASALGRELMASPALRREFKFSILVPARNYYPQAGQEETVLLQGVVDCCFETEEGLTVVDFKTDHLHGPALEERAREYRPQLAAYGQALAQITGKPVTRLVLWFFSEGRAIEI